ncbi:MAG: barstar family protein [Betaproteobacteria bacterium]|nr:barstar family protein [Betaproteobacteria bacterium]
MTPSRPILDLVLHDASLSGVYRIARADRVLAEAPAGMVAASLAGAMAKEEVIRRIAAALDFPDWFDPNWDALQDCLCDLSWRESTATRLLIKDADELLADNPGDWATLLDVLTESAQFWAAQELPFFVLLADPHGDFDLPTLPGDAPA